MIIRSVDFSGSAVDKTGYPNDGLAQIVISGKSNVGKSSFINSLLNHKNIARVSQTPGKTRLINFFLINKSFYFVDLPGYGYASVSKKQLLEFARMIEEYLTCDRIVKAILLLDIRRVPNTDDLLMYEYFKAMARPVLIVLTKADKLSNNQRAKQIKQIEAVLKRRPQDKLYYYSIKTKVNHEEIWDELERSVEVVK